jgi:F420-dependent oxidoreductase-like protein
MMDLDILVQRFDWPDGPARIGATLTDVAQTAESINAHAVQFMDHLLQVEMLAPAEDPMLEGYTTLGFLAGRTTSLRLRLLVTGVTYRHPGLLAKIVSTLDVLSSGRGELGIGAAWYEREHIALGMVFPPLSERFEMLEETLQICLKMWSDDNGPFLGQHFQIVEALSSPRTVSDPRPRIMIGGVGERKTLRLVALYADACNIPISVDAIAHKLGVLRRHCEDVGRDPREIEVSTTVAIGRGDLTDADAALREAARYATLGVSAVSAPIPHTPDPAGWLESQWGSVSERLAEIEPGRWY